MAATTAKVREKVRDRIHKVLRQEYSTELQALNSNPTLPNLEAPSASEIHITSESVEALLEENVQTGLMITDEGPRELIQNTSSSGSRFLEHRELEVATSVIFRLGAYATITHNGKEQTRKEIMKRRGDRHVGAMDECIRKYAPDGDAIYDVELNDDFSVLQAAPDDLYRGGVLGVAGAKFSVEMQSSAPSHQQLP